ncbi:MAG: DUF5685 family protein [Acetivibrio sp.]
MFGYVQINQQELKIKDYEKYQAYYCGLCKTLKKSHGRKGQLTLTYDMTFLVIFLTALYEPEEHYSIQRCMMHPLKKHKILENEISVYAADMNILMTYYKCIDDWQDEKSLKGWLGSVFYKHRFQKVVHQYKRQSMVVEKSIHALRECEKSKETNLDVVSRCFGELIEELFVYKVDEWEDSLRKIGFFLGKFIYLLDAYDDLEKDKKNGNYNPFLTGDYQNKYKEILTLMMAECAKEFEKLPIIKEADILRNIIYSGVWMRYEEVKLRKDKKHDV